MAQKSLAQYMSALELFTHNPLWKTKVSTCSALYNQNIDTTYQILNDFKNSVGEGFIEQHRKEQNKEWFLKLINELLYLKIGASKDLISKKEALQNEVIKGTKTAMSAAIEYINLI
jgi:LAO/AO transport system kinase